jgi:hypothetical protein
MNTYKDSEVELFLASLSQLIYPNSSKYCYLMTIDHRVKMIEAVSLQSNILKGILIKDGRLDIWSSVYTVSFLWVDYSDIKEIYNSIFILEFEKVPMILNTVPEVAKWRLLLGK